MQNLKENLKDLPWKELQMRAKASGIRANQQKTKIIEQSPYRNKEWVLSEDCEAVEMTNTFSREAGTHSTLKALCGKPVSTDQKTLIEADPYFQKLKAKFGAQLPTIESNDSNIWWAPYTHEHELKREAIKTLPEFIARCMSA
uniref:Uncharacterized protein n=1 Tax=Globodera rostochiensis TaxID=31243 RepID=A0A914H8Z2_GLORO